MNYILNLRNKIGHTPIILVSSAVIVINKSNEILLQKRVDSKDWGLPGGVMELGESFKETAERELFEETNLKCNNLKLLQIFSGKNFYYKYPNGDETYNVIGLFKVTEFEGDLKVNDNEGLDLKFFSINNFPAPLEQRAETMLNKVKDSLLEPL